MGLFSILSNQSPNKVFLSLMLGVLAGLCYAFLMPMILSSLEEPFMRIFQPVDKKTISFLSLEISNYRFAIGYLILFLVILVTKSVSQMLMGQVAIDATYSMRTRLYRRIYGLYTRDLEAIGSSKLLVALTTDVPKIIAGVRVLPLILINCVVIVGLLGFLVYLNLQVFLMLLLTLIAGIATYQIPIYIGERYFAQSRSWMESLQEAIRGLIFGAKELKLSNIKRAKYYQDNLLTCEHSIRKTSKKAVMTMCLAITYGDLVIFLVIGVFLFVIRNYYAIETLELVGIIMALLYAKGPIAEILNILPAVPEAKVSLAKINQLFDSVAHENMEQAQEGESTDTDVWQTIALDGISYSYSNEESGHNFSVGPLDLRIERGEVTFIIGGNGSGKSTLAKLISLHYLPDFGKIYFGDTEVTEKNRNAYRQQISAIYLDFYLFDKLLDTNSPDLEYAIEAYLKDLELAEKVSISDTKFSTLSLSDGQKKRLALLVTLLEDRELYVFDEWAADQDPGFKEVFYTQILSYLKSKGKTIIVISHDDHYFSTADKLVKMENGKLVEWYPRVIKQAQ